MVAAAAPDDEAHPTAEREAQPNAVEPPATDEGAAAVGDDAVGGEGSEPPSTSGDESFPLPSLEDAELEDRSQQAICQHEEESDEVRRLAEAAAAQNAPSSDALTGEVGAEEAVAVSEAAVFEERLRALEVQLADVRRNVPVGRQSWGGAQAPERGAVRGRMLPAPPHVYASLPGPTLRAAVPAVHMAVVKPDYSGIGSGALRRPQHDALTPGQRALEQTRGARPDGCSRRLQPPAAGGGGSAHVRGLCGNALKQPSRGAYW